MDAVILMAGKGTRLNAGINKVFLDLNNKPVFKYSLDLLSKYVENIILVISPLDEPLIKPYLNDSIKVTYGGSERYLSVYNGIKMASSAKVLIHDGARPNINEKALKELIAESENYPALMLAKSEINTAYQMSEGKLKPLDRSKILLAATPQIIDKDLYFAACAKAKEDGFKPTDDISLLLHLDENIRVKYVLDEGNFKITTKNDLELARMVLKNA